MGKMAEGKRYDEGFKRHVVELYESGQRPIRTKINQIITKHALVYIVSQQKESVQCQ